MANKTHVPNLGTVQAAKDACQKLPIYDIVKRKLHGNMGRFSKEIGGHRSWLPRMLKSPDIPVWLLVLLSHRLGINLLDYYLQLQQPEHRSTVQTREMEGAVKSAQDETKKAKDESAKKDVQLEVWREKKG